MLYHCRAYNTLIPEPGCAGQVESETLPEGWGPVHNHNIPEPRAHYCQYHEREREARFAKRRREPAK